jgi:hypothetical protein
MYKPKPGYCNNRIRLNNADRIERQESNTIKQARLLQKLVITILLASIAFLVIACSTEATTNQPPLTVTSTVKTLASPTPSLSEVTPPREASSMTYDPGMGMPLLFGGAAATPVGYLNDTWAWDGHTWSQLHPATSPPARSDACLVYDAAAGQLVLFGGEAAATQLSDTWLWNGTTWTEQSAMPAPSGGYNSAAYDAAHHYILAYEQSETWIWMGTQWKKLD